MLRKIKQIIYRRNFKQAKSMHIPILERSTVLTVSQTTVKSLQAIYFANLLHLGITPCLIGLQYNLRLLKRLTKRSASVQ